MVTGCTFCISLDFKPRMYICHTPTNIVYFPFPQALSKNGKVFGNGIMVGVQPCIDKVCVYFTDNESII